MSPVIVWLFLELWGTVYLLMTSEYVFVAVPYSDVTSKYTVAHSSKNNQTITGLIFVNGEQQYTVKNFTRFNFFCHNLYNT